jgi:hypothetical protein
MLNLPLPDKAYHPNSRCHWAKVASAKKADRQLAALSAISSRNLGEWDGKPFGKTEVYSHWLVGQRNDQDNLVAHLKATLDGLADAGIVANDRDFVIMPPTQEVRRGLKSHQRGLVLTLKEIADG